ncbi:nitrite reductase small subunit NirD [soil metagenome]
MNNWIKVCTEEDIPLLEGRRVAVEGFQVALFHTEEGFYATDDTCPHRGGPLSAGDMAGTTISCPLHNRKIEMKTGEVKNDKSLGCVFTFPVKVEDGEVYVDASALSGKSGKAVA